MYLKSLELAGFKSFAKKAILHFNTPITGIVGPNGSGKSNTAEAFRFVLGEQSIKSLRGKRGEDMIWNGGGEAGRANRASAKLTFDNSRRMFQGIDFDEVTLERIVHRDNSNEYLLNGTQVRLKDITELLATAHIGATGHHIISQGEADRILSASIRERREMIEDALGLKIYQWKKTESIRKLEKTEENMERVASLRREIAPHLRFLKKQVEKIEKAEELRRELTALYKVYFAREEWYVTSQRRMLDHALAGPQKELAELDQYLQKAKDILTASKHKDATSDEVITLEKALADVRIEKDKIVRELGRLEGEISANKRAIDKEKEKQKRDEFKTVYLKDVEEIVHTIESFKSIQDVQKLFGEVLTTLKSFVTRHRGVTDSVLIGEIEKEIATLSIQREGFERTLQGLTEREHTISREYHELKSAIEKEKDTNRDAEKEVFRIIARQNEVRHVVSDLTAQREVVIREEDVFKHELGEAGMTLGRDAVTYEKIPVSEYNLHGETGEGEVVEARSIQVERRHQIEKIKIRLEDAGGLGGGEVMKEYRETEERDAFLARELADLEKAKVELHQLIADLDTRIDLEFKTGILKINTEFKKFFALMFGGGTAELTVVKEIRRKKKSDSEELGDALSGEHDMKTEEDEESPEGLEVNVSLPRKKVKGLMMLSGGERALTSIALLFAISQVNPPPFIILDETDAALDEANSKKYGDMIESLSAHSQLILITHNRETMSRAGVLYGVTMGSDGASKLLS
ncbi:MAG: AAA family ATPase, partial [Candidatus Taylorbacteria bacterium]